MEPLYPQNILERYYPILRERREREEREQSEEARAASEATFVLDWQPEVLHENAPLESGSLGRALNTVA